MFNLPNIVTELLISAVLTFVITLIYRFLANQGEIKQLKLHMKEKQAQVKELQKTNPSEATKLTAEIVELSSKQMRHNMKPMLLTLVVVSIALPWMGGIFSDTIFKLPFEFPKFLSWLIGSSGWIRPWLAWYVLVSIPFGVYFRKILGVEM